MCSKLNIDYEKLLLNTAYFIFYFDNWHIDVIIIIKITWHIELGKGISL